MRSFVAKRDITARDFALRFLEVLVATSDLDFAALAALVDAEDAAPPQQMAPIAKAAIDVGDRLGGDWSIDFMQDAAGNWWLIDMAIAQMSWGFDQVAQAYEPRQSDAGPALQLEGPR